MPSLPVPTQTDAVIQNQTTGAVDYLKYQGTTLVASDAIDYGLASTWKIVADGNFGLPGSTETLVAQSTATGQLDFIGVNGTGQMVSSLMTSTGLPAVHGEGYFGAAAGQSGPALISQLPNGQLDFLAFNSAGTLVASDLVANSMGLPTLVGGGAQGGASSEFAGISSNTGVQPGSVITQLANGELEAIGFNGNISNGALTVSGTFLMPQTLGAFPASVVNPDFSSGGLQTSSDIAGPNGTLGVQVLTQSGTSADSLYLDSGYNSPATEGALYASSMLAPLSPGWNFVDGSFVAQQIFPVI